MELAALGRKMSVLDHTYAVIMAGGGGVRLWPLSRKTHPKQMVRLLKERTLFQLAVDRLQGLLPLDRVYVVTAQDQAPELMRQYPQIPVENFLLEPSPKNTATVVGYAAVALRQRDPQASMIVLTADHFIENVPYFQRLLQAGLHAAEQGYLVTLGIEPTYPTSGYGYIQQGKALPEIEGMPVYAVAKFIEKPPREQAEYFLTQGGYAWNSGMFIWKVARIWEEFVQHMPDLAERLTRLEAAWSQPQERTLVLAEIWPGIDPQPVDRGIMEHTGLAAVLPAQDLGWSDVGNWDSFFEVLEPDENGNLVLNGRIKAIDTTGTLVYGQAGRRLVTLIGVEDLIVVDTPDALLICNRHQVQKVRQLVELLRESGDADYL
jgi:mannose-1-phosphate guanylyltransferase